MISIAVRVITVGPMIPESVCDTKLLCNSVTEDSVSIGPKVVLLRCPVLQV